MSLLRFFHRCPARQPGRHSAEWAAMVQGLTELQHRCRAAEAARASCQLEAQEREQQFVASAKGWEDALDYSSEQYAELKRLYDERGTECERLTRENEAQRKLLDASTRDPRTAPSVAPLDDPESCFSQPSPPPAPDSRRAEPFPDAPVSSEAADVNAETQAVDVAALRDSSTTQQLAVPAAWAATALPAQPPLPDLAPTLAMPLAEAPLATEVSRDAADAALASVAAALKPDLIHVR